MQSNGLKKVTMYFYKKFFLKSADSQALLTEYLKRLTTEDKK